MPLSKNPHNYPIVCWNVLDTFSGTPTLKSIVIDPKDEKVDGQMETKDQLRRARNLQLQFNGFRQSLRIGPHPQVDVIEQLEFVIRSDETGGWVLKIQRRSTSDLSRAIELGLKRAGITIDPDAGARLRAQTPTQTSQAFPRYVERAPARYQTTYEEFDSLSGQRPSDDDGPMPPHEAIEKADSLVSGLLGLSAKAGTKEAELPKTLAEFNRQRGEQPGLDPAALVTKGLIDAEKKNEQGS